MIVQILRAEFLDAAIVGIADERRQTVRLRVRRHEIEHPLEALPRRLRNGAPRLLEQQEAGQKQFEHEAVIRRGRFVVDTVGIDLRFDLVGQDPFTGLEPPRAIRRVAEQHAHENQADRVAEIVIAVDVRGLEIPARRTRRA